MHESAAHSSSTKNDVGIELALGAKLTEKSDCHMLVTIQRSDSHNEPCIFSWSQHDNYGVFAGFLLFRHTERGLIKIEIDDDLPPAPEIPFLVDGWNSTLRELAPGGRTRFMASMPKKYRKELVAGSQYQLVWPGGEFGLWDWGTIKQHMGQDLSVKSSKIYLPRAQVTLEFDKFGQAKERQSSPPPITASERMQFGTTHITINVVYESPSGSPPIIFHTRPFISWFCPREGYRLYRRRGDLRETIEDDATCFMIVDDPDVSSSSRTAMDYIKASRRARL
ncbi:hypothetical protein EDB81DRAFT_760974 [Dactylonectria macrodidyma]|uniref:Uncharacterized protein n=1 Tax=Dactylonectria macrodidyma TaxID=307937 RepID=A0A9P9IZY9_9HYPO|nr:hypothetical protein EDB81DRAFT_760974 [Dactylonectria macrodidyma]